MEHRATDSVLLVQVWAKLEQLSKLVAGKRGRCMHEQINFAVHDGLIDGEAVLRKLKNRLYVSLVQCLVDDLLRARKSLHFWIVLNHFFNF